MNNNEGFVTGCLTLATVLTTAITVFLMYRSNRTASKSLAYAVELEDRRSRPFLIFDLEYVDKCVFAVLKNIGQSPAVKIAINISPKIMRKFGSDEKSEIGMTKYPPSQFLPGQSRRDFIELANVFHQEYGSDMLNGSIGYLDLSGKYYDEKFSIDLKFMLNLHDIVKPDIAKELKTVADKISKIEKHFSSYLDRTRDR